MMPSRRIVTALIATAATFVFTPPAAWADHFRGATLSWTLVGPNTVEFRSYQEFEATSVTPLPINPGDNDPVIIGPVSTVFTGTDLNGDSYRIITYTVTHTYVGAGPFTAYLGLDDTSLNCCRFDGLINAPGADYRIETVVDLQGGANAGGPASQFPPVFTTPRIVQLPAGSPVTLDLLPGIADPDDPFDCMLAPVAVSGIPLHVDTATLAVSTACVLSLDTTGLAVGNRYAVQILLVEMNGTMPEPTATLDFIVEISEPTCGDGFIQIANGEECDGASNDAMCDGLCRPPGHPLECTCPGCGDDFLDMGEQCDGTAGGIFGACPGECEDEFSPIACQCPVCGDGVFSPLNGEECDATDDAACPGDCLSDCTCALCGNGIAETPVEQCDGLDDGACPGDCLADCSCAVCGDGIAEAPAEECDGIDDGACPGDCLADCSCAVCGDNDAEMPVEQCDGTDDAACPGACLLDCTCAACGDGIAEGPEECDGIDDGACPGDCLANCTCADCGDNVTEPPVEDCDGTSDAACPGQCRPPGDANECQCAACGDGDVNQMSEQCDGADDAACPGECLSSCLCPVCGDGDVNQMSEECDGLDDSACPGECLSSCLCATCGDNVAEAPVEGCDGTDDASCPGECLPPGNMNECECPVCGDGDVNQMSEECDGAADGACPGNCLPDCTCAVCGDNVAEAPVENCDGTDDAACPGECLPPGNMNECRCPICGDGDLNQPGEVCEPPNEEICNNLVDDNSDQLTDCEDPLCSRHCEHDPMILCSRHRDCRQLQAGSDCVDDGPTCGDDCTEVLACQITQSDPARIRFDALDGGEDYLFMHAQFSPSSPVDMATEGFGLLITNASGVVYRTEIPPGVLVGNATGKRFMYRDKGAKDGNAVHDGIYTLKIVVKDGKYAIRLRSYADLSAATVSRMTAQFVLGNDSTSLTADWKPIKNGWSLHDFLFD